MIKLSILVPIFNIEKVLLHRCIQSILDQILQEIEIRLADNLSSKQITRETLNKYNIKNNKIILLTHPINKKQCITKNNGIKILRGNFIGFVTTDDYIDKTMYELLYNKAIEYKYNIVHCNLTHVNNNYKTIKNKKIFSIQKAC